MGEDESRPVGGGSWRVTAESLTVEYLKSWEEHGATWRPLEVSDQRAVVELCTCFGEPVDVLSSEEQELISYVRSHPPP